MAKLFLIEFFMIAQFILLLFMLTLPFYSAGKTIKVAAIDWCPQIYLGDDEKGYVVDLIKEVYKDTGYRLDIQYYPWSRAIKSVSEGKADALLAPAKAEAPNLVYPKHEVGKQTMCFFTDINNQWHYQGPESLQGMQIGVAIDTSIEELNDYIKRHPEQFQFQPYHERHIIQNAHKLLKNRIDAFLFTKNSTIYTLKHAYEWSKYKEAGCVSETEIYMAFSPAMHLEQSTTKMIKVFEERMQIIKQSDFIEKLMAEYQSNH